jgi:hypothetical protein
VLGGTANAGPEKTPPSAETTEPAPQVSEHADRLLRDMSDYLKASKEYSFHADILYDDLLPSGQKILLAGTNDVALRKPDRLTSHSQGDTGGKRLWYDGKQITLLDETDGVYASEKAPGTIDAVLDHMTRHLKFTPPLSDLLYGDPHAVLRRNTLFGFHVGLTDIDGARCHHLAFVEKNIDWQIWIDAGTLRVPRRLLITYKTLPGAPQFIANLSAWDFSTRLADPIFTPELPAGAARIEFLKAAAPSPAKTQAASKAAK